ncbi:MAG: HEAT repeat domain-containing protein [Planctomycetes bacterium]|nr:HEAT repeat domain-containing protein [Planctomycetota bacterium]
MRCFSASWFHAFSAALAVAFSANAAFAQALELGPGDRVSILGNTLAERMQHDGWLETLIQARFPERQVAFRNLGFSGDELTVRLRSANFGSPDDWLAKNETDVIFAFFGYNESFAGEAGLDVFKQNLANEIRHWRGQKYNGESAPRVVVFSPIAHEHLGDRNLPDGTENNARLLLYTTAMREVAQAEGALFVDLSHPMQRQYEIRRQKRQPPLSINGIHLTSEGNRALAESIVKALFPQAKPNGADDARLEAIRRAVLDKNFHWFNRYRTVDGYSIYGGRADLKFVEGQTNRDVMQREMEVLDAMTANRDRVVWAAAQGTPAKPDDSSLPPFVPVTTNKPGPLPGGKHLFLSGEDSIEKMTVHEGMRVELVASEEDFPELINPVQMAFDTRGRLWVAAWPTYPHWKPGQPMNDKLLILEDTDGDGRTDEIKTFAGNLHNPTGFEFWGGGVLVAMAPDILFLKDTDGDDKADVFQRVLHGIDSADTHHTANSFVLSPGGAMYFQEGTFHHTQVESPWGPPVRTANAAVFRFEPRTFKFDDYVSFGFANPHGHVFDDWGQDIVHDGTGSQPYHGTLFSGRVDFPRKHPKPPQVYQQRTRPCPATEILSSKHFPEDMQGNLLVGNVIGFQGILRYEVGPTGASLTAQEREPILSSSDPNFRPVDLEIGPDGALYFVDWQNPIIGHMQHNLRDPSRDAEHGRVYRVIVPERRFSNPPTIAGEPVSKLLDVLKQPEDRVRYRARIELSARDTQEVVDAANRWVAALAKHDPHYEHHVLEALWLFQSHNVVDEDLLKRVLASRDHRARAAATRVLCDWRDRVAYALEMIKKLAADEHPLVRLEAVRAASFFEEPEAVEIPLISAEHPTDEYLDYTRGETMATLEPYWKKALSEGREIAFTSDAGARFLLKNVSTPELLKMPRNRGVFVELLYRSGVTDDFRREAIAGLAHIRKASELRVLLDAIAGLDERDEGQSVVFDLVRLLTARNPAELAQVRDELENMATDAKLPVVRQIGYVALIAADGSPEAAWKLALGTARSLRDLVLAVRLIPDPSLRAALYPKLLPLLQGLPPELASEAGAADGTLGRYVRIELPGRRTLTLAEVEVYSDGTNIARRSKATQKNTAHGGDAARGIDGKTDGSYGAGGQTHTQENTENPWWELDLGREAPIERIVIHNRTDGGLGQRLDGFTLTVLSGRREPVFQQQNIPAPKPKAEFAVGGGGAPGMLRRAAMTALVSIRGHEAEVFQSLADFVHKGTDRIAAIRALQQIPRPHWPPDAAPALVATLTGYIEDIPVADRTTPAALDALELAGSLATLLPAEEARAARARLGELGVRVIRIGTVPHRMAFDEERLVVAAGKPVEFLFENSDIMPHNLVITQPGHMAELGELAEATATQPGAMERGYVPPSPHVLLASELLFPTQSQKLSFTAPERPGIYPYVCTYPGHWRRMYGSLYVVDDLDAYFADPAGYLAAHPLPIEDELLKFNRPRTEWQFGDLEPLLETFADGRSYGTGKQMFTVANCVACHKLNGEGREIGPDLTKLDPKQFGSPAEVLKEILDPSARINEKFHSYTFELASGKVVSGLILEETPEAVQVIENPLAKTDALVLKPSEIVERVKSKASIMPKGLVEKLTREEILDLVAYVTARGQKDHPLFHGGGHHHHGHGHEHGK